MIIAIFFLSIQILTKSYNTTWMHGIKIKIFIPVSPCSIVTTNMYKRGGFMS